MMAPRVLIVSGDQWPRALIRSALRELGYDAVGTRGLESAMRISADEPGRGTVKLIVVEQSALGGNAALVRELLARHGRPATLLLAHATSAPSPGQWTSVMRRPFSVDAVVQAVATLLPLASEP